MNNEIDKYAPVRGKTKVYFYSMLGITAVATVLELLALVYAFDADPGYFRSGAFLPASFIAISVIGVIWALSSMLLIPRGVLPAEPEFETGASFFMSTYAGFVMLADLCYRIYTQIVTGRFAALLPYFTAELRDQKDARSARINAMLIIVCIVSSLIAAVYFFLRANGSRGREWYTILGFFPILRALAGVASMYFDMTVAMNSPIKILLQVGMISSMFYFLYEIRLIVSVNKARPRAYFAIGNAAMLLTLPVSVCVIFAYFNGMLTNAAFCIEAFITLTFFLYITARVGAFCRNLTPSPEPEAAGAVTPAPDDEYLADAAADEETDTAAKSDGNDSVNADGDEADGDEADGETAHNNEAGDEADAAQATGTDKKDN